MEEEQREENNGESLSLSAKSHRHNYKREGNYLICHCGKRILDLEESGKEGLFVGKKGNGSRYSVREDRRRYFFPDEWIAFIKLIKNKKHKLFFLTSLHSGGRIMEVLNLQHKDIDIERETIIFKLVKQRKAKKNFFSTGKTRSFFVSGELIKEYKSFIRGRSVKPEDYIFLQWEITR